MPSLSDASDAPPHQGFPPSATEAALPASPTQLPVELPPPRSGGGRASSSQEALSWGLFWRLLFSQAGVLFLFAGIVCFFAYNWAEMPFFAKCGLITAGMLAAAALALTRGLYSPTGGLGLLLCGLLAGPLMAVYGQHYQTGADAWELFRAWGLLLLPLALVGRQTALWFFCWAVICLWVGLWEMQETGGFADLTQGGPWPFPFLCGQIAFLCAWEAAARFLAAPGREFLHTRWFPRLVAAFIAVMLTYNIILLIIDPARPDLQPIVQGLLYLAVLLSGAWWYTRQHDLFMIAYGLGSLVILLLAVIVTFSGEDLLNIHGLLFIVLILLGSGALAGKILLNCHKNAPKKQKGFFAASVVASLSPAMRNMRFALLGEDTHPVVPSPQAGTDSPLSSPSTSPWIARVFMGITAWIAVPAVLGLFFLIATSIVNGFLGGVFAGALLSFAFGAVLARKNGAFAYQAALCFGIAGTIQLGAALITQSDGDANPLFLCIVSLLAGFLLIRNNTYRCLAATCGAVLFCLLLYNTLAASFLAAIEFPANSLSRYIPLFPHILISAGVALLTVWLRRVPPGKSAFITACVPPLSQGFFAALLVLGIFPLIPVHELVSWRGYGMETMGIGCGIALLVLARHLGRELALRPHVRLGLAALAGIIAVLSWWIPWLGAGLLCLALARADKSLPGMGLCAAYFAVCAPLEYYNLNSSLLDKSFSLAEVGVLFLGAALLLHRALGKKTAGPAHAAPLPSTSAVQTPPAPAAYRVLAGAVIAVFLCSFVWAVHQKETLLASGTRMVLPLRPLDPRSLMQGDYMDLAFDIERAILDLAWNEPALSSAIMPKAVIVTLNAHEEPTPQRLDLGQELAPGEKRLRFRQQRMGRAQISSGTFFFQEGHGQAYERARFAELKVAEDGTALITHLLDGERRRIEPGKEEKKE